MTTADATTARTQTRTPRAEKETAQERRSRMTSKQARAQTPSKGTDQTERTPFEEAEAMGRAKEAHS